MSPADPAAGADLGDSGGPAARADLGDSGGPPGQGDAVDVGDGQRLIASVLSSGAVGFEAWGDPIEARLLPAEEPMLARAVEKRRRELTTGRWCARQALRRLGAPVGAILRGSRGEPLWPEGVMGSITHCAGYRAAAVAWATQVPALGIDAEPHEPLPPGILDTVSLPEERHQLRGLAESYPDVCWDRLLFCAKEATYKAWYPHAGKMLDFHEATITLEPHGCVAVSRLLVPGPVVEGRTLAGFSGRWRIDRGIVLVALTEAR